MNPKTAGLALSILAVLSIFMIAGMPGGSDADENNDTSIEYLRGFIYEIPSLEDRRPIEGVTVTTWDNNMMSRETVTTDANGMFRVSYDSEIRYISFTLEEYTVKDWCDELYRTSTAGTFEIKLLSDSQIGGVHNLFGNSGATATISRTVATLFGTVSGIINGSPVVLKDATVTLQSDTHTLSAKTNENGYFSVACSSGTSYDVTVTANGFNTYKIEGVQALGQPIIVSMTEKSHVIVLGLDTAHTLTLIGLLLTVLLVLIAIYFVKRPEQHGKVYVINDVPTKKLRDKKN